MIPRCARAIACASAAAVLVLVSAAPPAPAEGAKQAEGAERTDAGPAFAVVYAEANVDGASGGHAAVRFGDAAYHFQRWPDATFRVVRDDWERFRELYGELQNRTLHVATLDVAPADGGRVRARFDAAFAAQERDLALRERLRRDVAWLEAAQGARGAAGAGGAPSGEPGLVTPPLPGAGLLEATLSDDAPGARLREAVLHRTGDPGAIDAARAAAQARLSRVSRAADALDLEALREILLEREALAALAEGRGVPEEALVRAGDGGPARLGEGERAVLVATQGALVETVAALLGSPRPDRGRPLALAIARWHALERSLAEGRLLLLWPYPDDAARIELDPDMAEAALRTFAERATALHAEARAELLGGPVRALDEPRVSWLEETAGRAADRAEGVRTRHLREGGSPLVPSRGRPLALPDLGRHDPASALAEARLALRTHERLVAERYRYDLVRRNCITELVRTWNDAFGSEAAARAALGERLSAGARLGFIPFVFFDQVTDRLRIASVEVLPSARHDALARVRAEEGGAAVYLREATTLTSTLYEPRLRDGAFLLFTDDVVWPRPLYGLMNLVFGLGTTTAGVLAAPFDGGDQLVAGARGVLFSLPELVFVNLRKGSYELAKERR